MNFNLFDYIQKSVDSHVERVEKIFHSAGDSSIHNSNPAEQERIDAEIRRIKSELSSKYENYDDLLTAAARQKFAVEEYIRCSKDLPPALGEFMQAAVVSMNDMLKTLQLTHTIPEMDDVLEKSFAPVMSIVASLASKQFSRVSEIAHVAARLESKKTISQNGAKGAAAKADKYAPLKRKAFELARGGSFASAHNAAVKIAPSILKMPEAKLVGLSEERAISTIAGWIRKEGITFERAEG